MQKTILAIDCDEVLADTVWSILAFNTNMFNGLPIQRSDITTFFWHELPGYNASYEYAQSYRDDFFASSYAIDTLPVPWSQQWVKKLKELWYDLKVVTSRWLTRKQLTLDRIEKFFPWVFSDIVFWESTIENHHFVNKAELMSHIGARCLVDDWLHNCLQIADRWYEAVLIDNPRNKCSGLPSSVHRVNNRDGVVTYMSWKTIS